MKELTYLIKEKVKSAFAKAGYDEKYAIVSLSNRPDLCEYQCNGALSAAKEYHKSPMEIAENVAQVLSKEEMFSEVSPCKPGFLNMNLSNSFVAEYIRQMANDPERFGVEKTEKEKTVIIDYGGANVAKPLHV